MNNKPYIGTYTQNKFFFLDPAADSVDIRDIARALSMQCRFGGHVNDFVSAAQHSVLVSRLVPAEDALWGLLHDAHEAYLVDIPTPIKRCMMGYKEMAAKVQVAICERFGLDSCEPNSVAQADALSLLNEARAFVPPGSWWDAVREHSSPAALESWEPKKAELEFLARFYELVVASAPANPPDSGAYWDEAREKTLLKSRR